MSSSSFTNSHMSCSSNKFSLIVQTKFRKSCLIYKGVNLFSRYKVQTRPNSTHSLRSEYLNLPTNPKLFKSFRKIFCK
ncbi:unnamed protein product [Arabidopsis halleri]